MIKLVDNSNRDVKFAYSNEVARICDSLSINAQEVIKMENLNIQELTYLVRGW